MALDDLKKEQIEAFAVAKGVTEPKPFLDAIERADAWSFTSRPQDLQEVVDFWLDEGRVGTRIEIMRNSIERRLTERSQDRAEVRPLSRDRAREGARLLAAATTLGRDQTIQVQDGADNKKGVRVGSVLGDWEDLDQTILLSRPIFDGAIYGTMRFHHRPVREYLAAEWLAELLKRPASRRNIEALLFRKSIRAGRYRAYDKAFIAVARYLRRAHSRTAEEDCARSCLRGRRPERTSVADATHHSCGGLRANRKRHGGNGGHKLRGGSAFRE